MSALVDVVLRSSAVFGVGLLLAAMLGRQSAALRHVLLAATLALGALAPALQLVTPDWAIQIRPPAAATSVVGFQATSHRSKTPESVRAVAVPPAARPRLTWSATLLAIWAIGTLGALTMLGTSLWRLRRLGVRATPVQSGAWSSTAAAIAAAARVRRRIALLETGSPDLLATWGLLRPRILLPRHARNWSVDRISAVLHHEIAHVRRGDWLVQIGAEIVRGIYWFNPLVWLACRALNRESERACDDEVLGAGVAARDYAGHLLEIARSCRVHSLPVAAVVPMARPSTLQSRVAAMLNPHLIRTRPSARAIAIVLLGVLCAAVPAAAIRVTQAGPMPLTGVLYDPTGAVLPEASLKLEDSRQNTWATTSDSTGRFEFPPVQEGSYHMLIELPGFKRLEQVLTLQAAADWTRAVTMQVGDVQETITVRQPRSKTPRRPAASGPVPVRVGGNIKPPTKVKDVKPIYPESMREAGLEGMVPLEAIIGKDGNVASLRVLTAQIHPDLAQAAMEAVRQWLFTPTLLNGKAVEVVMNVSVTFELED